MLVLQTRDELLDTRAQLVREVRRRRPAQRVDVVRRRFRHCAESLTVVCALVRRVSPVDLMLLGTILLWALNITVTRYVLTHGWHPLSYGTIRYFVATALFWCFTYWREESFRVRWRDVH